MLNILSHLGFDITSSSFALTITMWVPKLWFRQGSASLLKLFLMSPKLSDVFFRRAKILWCCLACKIFLRPLLSPWVLPEMSTVCFCAVAFLPKMETKRNVSLMCCEFPKISERHFFSCVVSFPRYLLHCNRKKPRNIFLSQSLYNWQGT